MRAGLEALHELAGADNVVTLTGGVRGWAEILGCSPSWPKTLLHELERRNFIAGVEIYPGEGGLVAEVYLLQATTTTTTRSVIESAPIPDAADEPAEIAVPHQDAKSDPTDSISDRTPPTPPHVVHDESMCGGGGEIAHPCELADQDLPAYRELLDLGVGRPEAEALAPLTSLVQIRYLVASGRREPARDLPAWVVAGIRDGRRPPQHLAPLVAKRQAAPPPVAPAPAPAEPAPPPDDAPLLAASPPAPPPPADPARRRFQMAAEWALMELRRRVTRQERDAWLHGLRIEPGDDGDAVLIARDALHRDGLARYAGQLARELGSALGRPPLRVRIVTAGEQFAAAAD